MPCTCSSAVCGSHVYHGVYPFGEPENLSTGSSAFAHALRHGSVKSVVVSNIHLDYIDDTCCEFCGCCVLNFLSKYDDYNIKVSDADGNEFIIPENTVLSFNDINGDSDNDCIHELDHINFY